MPLKFKAKDNLKKYPWLPEISDSAKGVGIGKL